MTQMIDAHFHAWQLDRGDYDWLTPELLPIYRDVKISDWVNHADMHKIKGGVLVQAAPTFEETLFLLHQAHMHPMVKGVVGWIDMLAEDAIQKVALCAASPKLKGLRPMLQDIPDPNWILQPQIQPVLNAMAERNLVLDALIKPIHIQQILAVSRAHPRLKIVIDHGAKPIIHESEMLSWKNQMKQLAQATDNQQVMCKLSGLWTEAARGQPVVSVQPWCKALLEIWTPHRLIWGSDWPVLELAGSYSLWREFSLKLIKHYSQGEQDLILGVNAKNIYKL
jgi:L-fuconolactonase